MARICDQCERKLKQGGFKIEIKVIGYDWTPGTSEVSTLDLCESCKNELMSFGKGEEE